MSNNITLNDLMTKSAEELIPDITVDNKKDKWKEFKKKLRSSCYTELGIKVGDVLQIDSDKAKVVKVLPSTGRIFLEYDGKEFSVTRSYLTGEDTKIPFEVGDEVLFLKTNDIGTVEHLVPSSNKVRVKFENNEEKLVSANKLQKLEKE